MVNIVRGQYHYRILSYYDSVLQCRRGAIIGGGLTLVRFFFVVDGYDIVYRSDDVDI